MCFIGKGARVGRDEAHATCYTNKDFSTKPKFLTLTNVGGAQMLEEAGQIPVLPASGWGGWRLDGSPGPCVGGGREFRVSCPGRGQVQFKGQS